ncbi:MAG: type II secretion system protein [Candidatus Magasanikbacteria bacterium]|nr:type II secretion system protein [Candidatus Magasanikbacteria bacterium]
MLPTTNYSLQTCRGFTLLELLLSIAVISVVAGVALPVSRAFQARNDLDIAAASAAQTLRRAQVLAQGMDGDISWGTRVQSGSITLFRGASYATRDASFDEVFDVPTTITLSGLTEVVFSKFTGDPTTTGTFTLTSSDNEVMNLTINTKGTITY